MSSVDPTLGAPRTPAHRGGPPRHHFLLGPLEVAPSRIFWNGAFVAFPLRPLQALTSGGAARSLAAMLGLLRARLWPARARSARDFGTWATATFGRSVAEAFLIPFSEKLWGLPAGELSPEIAGRRLPGFTLAGIAREVLFGRKADHLEGRFLYPRHGYGQIVDAMAARLTPGRLRCGQIGRAS